MLRALALALPLAFLACNGGGKDEDTGPTLTCDDAESDRLGTVPVDQWPEGLSGAISAMRSLEGQWRASCGDDTSLVVEIGLAATNDDILILQELLPSNVVCGADYDPDFPSDYELDPLAFSAGDFAISGFAEETFQVISGPTDLTLFAGESGMSVRISGTYKVPLAELSRFDRADVVLRSEAGQPSGMVFFVADSGTSTCTLTNWARN